MAEVDAVHNGLVVEAALLDGFAGGDKPLVVDHPRGGFHGVDYRRCRVGTSRCAKNHRRIVAGDIGVERVDVVGAVGSVHLHADGGVDIVVEVDGDFRPRLVDVAAGGAAAGGSWPAIHPRGDGHVVAGEGGGRHLEPERVVDGLVGPAAIGVLLHHADEELAGLVWAVAVTAADDGVVDEQQGVLRGYLHSVEEGFRPFVAAVCPGVAVAAVAGGARVAQPDAGGIAVGNALHAVAAVDGELVEAGVLAGDYLDAAVVGVPDIAVVAAGDASVGARVAGGRCDVGMPHDGLRVGVGAGAHHVVAGGGVGRRCVINTLAEPCRPEILRVGRVEGRCVAESRTGIACLRRRHCRQQSQH